jgi:hypothetical protein
LTACRTSTSASARPLTSRINSANLKSSASTSKRLDGAACAAKRSTRASWLITSEWPRARSFHERVTHQHEVPPVTSTSDVDSSVVGAAWSAATPSSVRLCESVCSGCGLR